MSTMKTKIYEMSGLSCAHCAEKIQNELSRINPQVTFNLNFSAGTLTISGYNPEDFTDAAKLAQARITEIEPGVLLKESSAAAAEEKRAFPLLELRLSAAAALFAASFASPPAAKAPVLLLVCLIAGYDVIWKAARNLTQRRFMDEHFLMTIATFGAVAIDQAAEGAAVMLFYQVGEWLQHKAVDKSRRSIKALLSLKENTVTVITDGALSQQPTELVKPGDHIVILPGQRFPLDCQVYQGTSIGDTSALTGEAVPMEIGPGQEILSGTVNLTGKLLATVLRPYEEGAVARILHLVENAASRKAPTEFFITRFAKVYTPAVVWSAIALTLIPTGIYGIDTLPHWFYRSLVFLVISCPCALVISIPLGFFGGIGAASKAGILVKGSNYLEALTQVQSLAIDKTGTLTEGHFTVEGVFPSIGFTRSDLLSLASAAESASTHPVARGIMAFSKKETPPVTATEHSEVHGQGVSAVVDGKRLLVGKATFLADAGVSVVSETAVSTAVHVALGDSYVGMITLKDQLKPDAKRAIEKLYRLGIGEIALLTGDSISAAKTAADDAGIQTVHAGLLPQDKVSIIEDMMARLNKKGKLVFVGDGINDAPVLARADVGIAMGAIGSDAAVEAADIVLLTDEPSKIADAIEIAKFTRKIVIQNIVLAFAVKALVLILGAGGLATLWEAVFADVGVAIMAVLNATRVLHHSASTTR